MRLIHGKIHDYYDVVAKYGHATDGNTFLRNPETIKIKYEKSWTSNGWKHTIDSNPLSFIVKDSVNHYDNYFRFKNKVRATVSTFKILFCGKVYKGIKFSLENSSKTPGLGVYTHHYCYDVNSIEELFLLNDDILPEKGKTRSIFNRDKDLLSRESLNKYFIVNDYTDICVANKYVIGIIESKINHNNGYEVVLNGRLEDYQFYRVIDPYTAYQELSMYVDGMLAYPGNIDVDIPDEYKIESKGFDKKYGFRTRPKN